MIIEHDAVIFDPAMRAEGGAPDPEFPICRDADRLQVSDKEEAAEQARIMRCKQEWGQAMQGPGLVDGFVEEILAEGPKGLPAPCLGDGVPEAMPMSETKAVQKGGEACGPIQMACAMLASAPVIG